jgi:hypothetical protein
MVINFDDFVSRPEATVEAVLRFVGADPERSRFRQHAPRMANDYKGASMHASVRRLLMGEGGMGFGASIRQLEQLLGGSLGWGQQQGKE